MPHSVTLLAVQCSKLFARESLNWYHVLVLGLAASSAPSFVTAAAAELGRSPASASIMLIVITLLIAILAIAFLLFRNSFFDIARRDGSSIEVSTTGFRIKSPPDHYSENGFEHLEAYLSRLLSSPSTKNFLRISTLDKKRGCGVFKLDSVIEVALIVGPNEETGRETNIRSFFSSKGMRPSSDYLAQNGTVRILNYPIQGTVEEVTEFTKTVLNQLCRVSPQEVLDIRYSEH